MNKTPNHNADIANKNKGTAGTNKTNSQNEGNRCKQLDPNTRQKQSADNPKPVLKSTMPPTGVSTIQSDFDKRGVPYPDWLKIRQSKLSNKALVK